MNKFVAKAILALAVGVVIPGGAAIAQNTQASQPSASVIAAMQALQNVKADDIANAIKALASKYDAATLATAAGALGFDQTTVVNALTNDPATKATLAAAFSTGVTNAANFALASAAGPAANNSNNQIASNQNSGFSGSSNSSFSGGGSGGSTTKASGS